MAKTFTADGCNHRTVGTACLGIQRRRMERTFRQSEWHLYRPGKMRSPEASAPVLFDDATGKIAILLREPVVGGKTKVMRQVICLYDKKTGRASIAEYYWLGK